MTNLSGQSLGRYHILEQLGEGGMATVYKAFDTRLETDVAVKVIRTETLAPTVLERALKRFEREAKALARLTHPNIVKVTDYGEYEGKPYLVMTYLPGGTLKQKLGKPLPWQEAARLLLPIARALDFAHRQNMIHRDVKPSNILITADGEPMLTDFGIAKILDLEETADLTGTGMGIGTPEYMAPEQWTGQTTQQSDQYSLGVVLYEMLTGRRPYTADTPAAILLKQANEPLPRPRQFARDLPDKVEKLILKAMAKNPADRYASMGAFASALDGLVISERSSVISDQSSVIGKKGGAEQTPKREPVKTVAKPVVEEKTKRVIPPVGTKKPVASVLRYWPIAVGVVAVLILTLVFNFPGSKTEQPAPTETQSVAPMAVELPTFTMLAPTAVELLPITETPAVVSIPEQVTDSQGVTMRLVPAGTFTMGSDSGDADEKPVHDVYLDSFYMDVYEVTNGLYKTCVDAGMCNPPKQSNSYSRSSYFGNSEFDHYPVIYVDPDMAQTYCAWRGGGLPSEAQWEKAARGTDSRAYPWGEKVDCAHANYASCNGETSAVGMFPDGASPFGLFDISGNVMEWVADWYDTAYYENSPLNNPLGPSSGKYHVLRGGSWKSLKTGVRSFDRLAITPDLTNYYLIGFRCARPAP
jgi:serine/threonine protein kinase